MHLSILYEGVNNLLQLDYRLQFDYHMLNQIGTPGYRTLYTPYT